MNSRFPCWIVVLVALSSISPVSSADKVFFENSSAIPPIDRTKTFEPKAADVFINKGFNTKNIEYKNVQLPDYFGNLEAYPLTEWKAPQSDYYRKTIDLKEFNDSKKQSGLQPWSKEVALKADMKLRENSELDDKNAKIKNTIVEGNEIPKGPDLEGQQLRDIINKGSPSGQNAPPIKVGSGFTTKNISEINEKPEKSSQPK